MAELEHQLRVPQLFAKARTHLTRAQEQRRECIRWWEEIRRHRPFSAWLEVKSENTAELWCAFRPAPEPQEAVDKAAGAFLTEIKSAMDVAVLAAALENVGLSGVVGDKHSMPLCFAEAEFDELPYDGWLMGLRPDQMNVIREVQPFATDGFVGHHIHHLALALRRAQSDGPLFSIWAGPAQPVPDLPTGYELTEVVLDEPSTVHASKRLATLRFSPRLPGSSFTGNPNVYFDPILHAAPWPADSDDNLNARTDALLTIARTFIDLLEDSSGIGESVRRLQELDATVPPEPADVWLPVKFVDSTQEEESRQAIGESDQGMAIYSNSDGVMTYMTLRNGQVVGREIPDAAPLALGESYGADVENATRAAAGRWGLPDFVLRPRVVRKGSGIREVGDGTILAGSRGIALQVKARSSAAPDSPDRARSWLLKNAATGLRQAHGTIRTTFQSQEVTLENLRGRTVRVAGTRVEWVRVVVLDHPTPPRGIFPPKDSYGPSVVLLRRDWEFLWSQLQSASAVVDYIHRVSAEDEPAELGSETHRYFDLADQDLLGSPSSLPTWMKDGGYDPANLPLLPKDPASTADEFGFRVFQRVLEDIAATNFTGDETDRVQMLSHIDRVSVSARADLGRLLFRRLISCGQAPEGQLKVEHRLLYVDHGQLHLSFTCMGRLTGYYHEMFRTWLLHRRQRFLAESSALGPVWPWSVGVLLTPRPVGSRLWDTTVIATNGPPHFDDAEYARLDAIYESVAPDPSLPDRQAG